MIRRPILDVGDLSFIWVTLDSPHHSALGFLDEGDQMGDLRGVCGMGGFQGAEGGCEVRVLFEEEFFVSGFQVPDIILGKATTLETYQIQAAGAGGMPIHDHEGRHVLDDFRKPTDDRVHADPAKLVGGGKA